MVNQIKLNYSLSDISPVIDEETMNLHYNKHHAAYTKNTNAILDKINISGEDPKEIFSKIGNNTSLRNNGGGWWNHNFYFESLCKPDTKNLSNSMKDQLIKSFGSYEKFVKEFSIAASTKFGSGWAWLGKKKDRFTRNLFYKQSR